MKTLPEGTEGSIALAEEILDQVASVWGCDTSNYDATVLAFDIARPIDRAGEPS